MLALAAQPAAAVAESFFNPLELRLVTRISVTVADSVTDGCLQNPDALVDIAELILRQAGISIDFENPGAETSLVKLHQASRDLRVIAHGWELKRGSEPTGECIAHLSVELRRSADMPEGHTLRATAFESQTLLTGLSKTGMQAAIREAVSEATTELANEILKARHTGN